MINVTIPAAHIGECTQFMEKRGNNAFRPTDVPTIVVTPLRITFLHEDAYKISFGCNLWKSCQNKGCSYCLAGMPEREPT